MHGARLLALHLLPEPKATTDLARWFARQIEEAGRHESHVSIDALRAPEVSSSFRSGNCSSVGLRKGVRSRIMQMMEKPFSAATAAFWSANGSLKTFTSTSGIDQSASFVATFW